MNEQSPQYTVSDAVARFRIRSVLAAAAVFAICGTVLLLSLPATPQRLVAAVLGGVGLLISIVGIAGIAGLNRTRAWKTTLGVLGTLAISGLALLALALGFSAVFVALGMLVLAADVVYAIIRIRGRI